MPKLNRRKLISDIEAIIGPTTSIPHYTDRNLFRIWLQYTQGRTIANLVKPVILTPK